MTMLSCHHNYLYLTIKIGGLEKKHKFLICDNLVFQVILSKDFMGECGIEIQLNRYNLAHSV